MVSVAHMILIALAGVGAGAINAVVGSGTLITFPTLVALGYPPVTATMSNAVGLVAGGISGTWGYRRELRGQWDRLRWQIPASLLGAVVGAWLLLHLPEKVFITVVPVLLIGALLLVVLGPRIQAWAEGAVRATRPSRCRPGGWPLVVVGTFAVGVYGGYFTAAQGILLIGVMGALLPESMQRMNAAKNLLSLVVNVVAAAAYTLVAFDRISWAGGRADRGRLAARRVPRRALRAAAVAERAARRHRGRRADRAVPPAGGLDVGALPPQVDAGIRGVPVDLGEFVGGEVQVVQRAEVLVELLDAGGADRASRPPPGRAAPRPAPAAPATGRDARRSPASPRSRSSTSSVTRSSSKVGRAVARSTSAAACCR